MVCDPIVKTFKDSTGHTWRIDINVATLLDIQSEADVDVMDADLNDLSKINSIKVMVDILWVTLFDQITQLGLDEKAFAARLTGKALSDATEAWMAELADFFTGLSPAKGTALATLWETSKKVEETDLEALNNVLGLLSSNLPG